MGLRNIKTQPEYSHNTAKRDNITMVGILRNSRKPVRILKTRTRSENDLKSPFAETLAKNTDCFCPHNT